MFCVSSIVDRYLFSVPFFIVNIDLFPKSCSRILQTYKFFLKILRLFCFISSGNLSNFCWMLLLQIFGDLLQKAIGSLWGGVEWGAEKETQITCVMILLFYFRRFFSLLLPTLLQSASNRDVLGSQANCLSPHWSLKSERARMAVHSFSKLSWGCGGRGVLSPPEQSQRHWAHTVQV